jgi:hypothetical protein
MPSLDCGDPRGAVERSGAYLTPAIFLETPSSRTVTCRVQPPDSSRTRESEKVGQRAVTSGGRDEHRSGFYRSRKRLRGPGSAPPRPGRCGCGTGPLCAAAAFRQRTLPTDFVVRSGPWIGSYLEDETPIKLAVRAAPPPLRRLAWTTRGARHSACTWTGAPCCSAVPGAITR